MSDTFVTIDQFSEILARLGKLEHKEQYVVKYEDAYKNVDDLKGKYYALDKRTEVTDTKIDATRVELKQDINTLRIEMNEKFNTMNEKFSSLEKRFTMMWVLQTVTFLAILGLYLKGIIF